MPFQLVLATDNDITVWHTDFGHIFRFAVDPARKDLLPQWSRDVPDAAERAASVEDAAKLYAVELARVRRLIA